MFAALVCFAAVAAGQTRIKVEAPNLVALDEQFNISFIVEGENSPSDFDWSPSDDFQLVWGPQKGTSTSISIVGGKRTKSSQTSYTYVLMPKKAGSFRIPAATAVVKGEKITSSSVSLEVVSGGAQQRGQGSQQGRQDQRSTGEVSSEDLFLRLTLSKSRAVVGEPVEAVLKLYQRVSIAGFEDARFPSFNGFWSQEVKAPTNIEFQRESVGDAIYNAAVIRSYVLIPQQAGELVIDPAELVCLVNVRTRNNSTGSIFDSFFQDDYRTIRRRVTTPEYKVKVSALPAGAPASFGGGVGDFSIKAELSRDSLSAHDAASLVITLSGKGNVSLLEAPKVNFPPDFEVYDVKTTEMTDKSTGRISGSKSFEYPFIPRSHGDFVIGPIEYSYYDVKSGKYVTLTTDELPISVKRGNDAGYAAADQQSAGGVLRKDVRDLGSDIRFIRTKEGRLRPAGSFFIYSGGFWAALAAILCGGLIAFLTLRKKAERDADVVGARNRAATKMARKRLANAGLFLSKGLTGAFYEELHKAALGYVGDKLNIDSASMNRDTITSRLLEAGAKQDDVDAFVAILDKCEMARYAPDPEQTAMKDTYDKAISVISALDSSVKKSRTSAAGVATILLLMLSLPLSAGSWDDGVAYYAGEDYASAFSAWSEIEAQGLESADLYFNMGNACFKLEDYSRAILYYERALRLSPEDADVLYNLEIAKSYTQDRIEVIPEMMISQFAHKMSRALSSDIWTILALVLLGVAVVCALVFFLSGLRRNRKLAFFGGIVVLLCSLMSFGFAQWQWKDYNKTNSAIVMKPVSPVKSSPGQTSSKDLFVLHEGTKVKVIDDLGEWKNIELSDGRQGWIPAADIEII